MVKIERPFSATVENTSPRIPKGANWMTHFTVRVMTPEKSSTTLMVFGLATSFRAIPTMIDQKRMPI